MTVEQLVPFTCDVLAACSSKQGSSCSPSRPYDEATELRIGQAYESATDWAAQSPAI